MTQLKAGDRVYRVREAKMYWATVERVGRVVATLRCERDAEWAFGFRTRLPIDQLHASEESAWLAEAALLRDSMRQTEMRLVKLRRWIEALPAEYRQAAEVI